MGKITSLKDILEIRKELDILLSLERKNGFKQRERRYKDIILSMAAETIEYNEETPDSHKTWKEKTIDLSKIKEEAIDILFFLAELINFSEKNLEINTDRVNELWEDEWKKEYRVKGNALDLLECIVVDCRYSVNYKISIIISELIRIFRTNKMTKDEVYDIFYNKYRKNIKRINEDWKK